MLEEVLPRTRMKMLYLYDFGDSWEHEIRVQNVHRGKNSLGQGESRCLDGAGASPPDDCGGVNGYYYQLQEWLKSGNSSSDELFSTQWFPDDFDPATFDQEAINHRLAAGG